MKYTVDDFINQKIIISCSYIQAGILVNKLKRKKIDTSVYYSYQITDMAILYFNVEHGKLIGQTGSETVMKEDGYKIIGFNELKIELDDTYDDKAFQLGEIVHAAINRRARESFNFFAGIEHITAIITRIDYTNKMCEIAYLYNRHKTLWVTFDEVFPIESIEGSEDD